MIGIIDYGLGNVQALKNVFGRLSLAAIAARNAMDLDGCTKLILPGVGAFDHAMSRFDASGLREPVEHLVRTQGIPVLGICVGMQMLANSSEEGRRPGLGWIDGAVRKLQGDGLALPHMGWNDVKPGVTGALFTGLERDARFYFLHSYYWDNGREGEVLATTEYGLEFACVVQRRNIYGVQFHPEKSHHWGQRLLKNFAEL